MQNRDLAPALEALADVMKSPVPVKIALAMAQLCRELEGRARDYENTYNQIVVNNMEYVAPSGETIKAPVAPNHPNFLLLRNEVDELQSIEFEPLHTFKLYVRTKDGKEEFCWSENFKTKTFEEFEATVIYGMMPFLEIVPT